MNTSAVPDPEGGPAPTWAALRRGLLVGAALLVVALPPSRALLGSRPGAPARTELATAALPTGAALQSVGRPVAVLRRAADFAGRPASPEARALADWVARSADNGSMPFLILDKRQAVVYVFDRAARLGGESPVLLGYAAGDDSVEGIGDRPLAQVGATEKTTPAGRFVAERGHDTTGEDVVWVDYDAAVAMHRVRVVDPKERRLERLASANPADRRISYGCINVPVAFFENTVAPVFRRGRAVVYVLPEQKSLRQVFGVSAASQLPG